MDTLTQENAALVEEAAAAAHSLTEQAVILQNALRAFRLREDDLSHVRHRGAKGRAAGGAADGAVGAAARHGDAAEYAVVA
jgi:methyl-accepting chemotaxis protein